MKYNLPKVLLSNVRSLHNKLDDLATVANVNDIDVIALTETWFDLHTPLDQYYLPDCALFSKHRNGRTGGGVALYAKHHLNPKLLSVNAPDNVEALWVHLRP